jgi:hypothetical protein
VSISLRRQLSESNELPICQAILRKEFEKPLS